MSHLFTPEMRTHHYTEISPRPQQGLYGHSMRYEARATRTHPLSLLATSTHLLSLLEKEPGGVAVVHAAVQPAHEVPHHHHLIVLTQQTF